MKRVISILGTLCFWISCSFAQTMEIGGGIGVSNFLGDLGKKQSNGRAYYGDVESSLFRPATGVFFRNNFNYFFAMKAGLTWGIWEGDDRLARTEKFMDDAWFRNYRNLHFKSNVFELSITGEVNFMRYIPGSGSKWITPYFMTGLAFVYSNPKTKYNGQWVALQPLGTEGQGMSQYPDRHPYSLFQPAIPVGIGLKVNATRFLTVGFEIGHRFTFTDYLDDVSTTYVSQQEFTEHYGSEKGTMIYNISRRSPEVDPEETYEYVTKPGEVRGNPGSNDAYLFSMVTVAYKFANQFSEFSYSHKRNSVRRNPAGRKKVKKYRRFVRSKTW